MVAFKELALGINVPNEYVAKYCDKYPERLIGFCCVDPNEDDAANELHKCVKEFHMEGLKLGPIYQNFDPSSESASKVFETAQELGIPVLIHQGTTFVRKAPLKYAYPSLLDEVAIRFEDLKIIIAHLGHPWEDETIVMIRKHPNVYSDVSALSYRPFRLFEKLHFLLNTECRTNWCLEAISRSIARQTLSMSCEILIDTLKVRDEAFLIVS